MPNSSSEPLALLDSVDMNLVQSVEDVLPLLRENAAEAERFLRLPAVNIKTLQNLGITTMTVPRKFGGLQSNAPTMFEVIRNLARACGSTSWVMAVYAACSYWVSLFPDSVQEKVFTGAETRVAGVAAPPSGSLRPVDGGYVLNGRWAWNTGVLDATWDVVAAQLTHDDGTAEHYLVVVPVSELSILDDWHMSAMHGTGSNTAVAQNAFVPADYARPFLPMLNGNHGSDLNRGVVEYSYAVLPFVLSASVGTLIGMAQGHLEELIARAPSRRISSENSDAQSNSPITQLQVGEISMGIETALALSRDTIASLHRHAVQGTSVTAEERIRIRAVVAYATRLSADATTAISRIGGASAFHLDLHGQRHQRDTALLANHALLNYEANLGLLGSVMMGNEPNTSLL